MLTHGVDQIMRQMMFCLPGRITAFDSETQLAQVECGIKRLIKDQEAETIPVIDNVPVRFSGDSAWFFYHQITPGETEGLIHFSQRAIDTWLDQGGPVAPHERRMLSEEDAFFSPGYRSKPGAIPSLPTEGAGLANYDDNVSIKADDNGITLTVGAQVLILSATGLTHNGVNIGATHTHPILSGSSAPGPTGTPT